MGSVLIQGNSVQCGHGGSAKVTSPAKLRVNNQRVLVKAGVEGVAVTGCSTAAPSKLCSTVDKVTAGEAVKLTVGGQRVLLAETFKGTTDGVITGTKQTANGVATQTKLTAT